MLFAKCPRIVGQCNVVEDALRVRFAQDVVVDRWSIYDKAGRMIRDSGFFRGIPTYRSVGGALQIDLPPNLPCLPRGGYFWLGLFQVHYGHFLVGTLSRLWAWSQHADAATRLVYVGDHDPDALFAIAYVRQCFEALGIGQDQLLRVGGPTRIPAITIAEPSFVENYSVAPEYARMMQAIGSALPRDDAAAGERREFVYLSKARVTTGNRIVVNESEVTDRLAGYGVEIVYPEQLSFPEQVRLWSRTGCGIGFFGSAFHTSAFVGRRAFCTISNNLVASSNQAMIDRVCGNRSLVVHPIGGFTETVTDRVGFHDAIVIHDPAWMAGELMRIVEGFRDGRITPQRFSSKPRRDWEGCPPETSFGDDLLPGGSVRTARAKGRTATWRIGFDALQNVHEIVVYGGFAATDDAGSTVDPISIEVSTDGRRWEFVYRLGAAIDSHSDRDLGFLRWRTAYLTLARHVRVTIAPAAAFRLERVAVFGEPPDREMMHPIHRAQLTPAPRRPTILGTLKRPARALSAVQDRWIAKR